MTGASFLHFSLLCNKKEIKFKNPKFFIFRLLHTKNMVKHLDVKEKLLKDQKSHPTNHQTSKEQHFNLHKINQTASYQIWHQVFGMKIVQVSVTL